MVSLQLRKKVFHKPKNMSGSILRTFRNENVWNFWANKYFLSPALKLIQKIWLLPRFIQKYTEKNCFLLFPNSKENVYHTRSTREFWEITRKWHMFNSSSAEKRTQLRTCQRIFNLESFGTFGHNRWAPDLQLVK